MLEMLRLEIGASLNPAHGDGETRGHIIDLRIAQENIYDEHVWPGFDIRKDITLEAGSYLYTIPDDMDLSKAVTVWIEVDGEWREINRGFDTGDFGISDPEVGETADRVLAWDIVSRPDIDADRPMIQIWPAPNKAMTLRFEGRRKLRSLRLQTDRCELDDQLIVLAASAKILARRADPASGPVRGAFKDRLKIIKNDQGGYGPSVFHFHKRK
jgi:hypothetical protein